MEFEPMDGFEKELRQALQRRPAPPSLKRKVMERRGAVSLERQHHRWLMWQRLAAGVVLAAILGGTMTWQLQKAEERRKGEEARRQVMTALRVTTRALNELNQRLMERNRGGDR